MSPCARSAVSQRLQGLDHGMDTHNRSAVEEFALQGFSEEPGLRGLFLVLFLLLFLAALAGNTLIVTAISLYPGLHTPVYFFLTNLAVSDIVCTSTVLPKLLENLAVKGGTISYQGCLTQLFFLTWILGDRYVAVCRPPLYSTWMGRPVRALPAGSVWAVSAASTSVHTGLMTRLAFCGPSQIQRFLCEVPTLLRLSCSPTTLNDVMIVVADVYFGVVSFLLTMASYCCIVASILRTRSTSGKRRAFSTCSSHHLVVALYYSTVVYTCILPGSGSSLENGKVVAVLYTVVSPTLNPSIYSLRNKDVKVALRKVFF
ncbi:hypothetical protein FD754_015420 [Muntiacus muntjak]|uniref:G-protein coupled receptors family 1 profile domain-containing protein n=1 Tax=Muntiacus muntjak TaxID=9888 RepID=A0A5N3VN91_MUNMU|nr:hypothetical protein FD754_015420 [Muntiacus muntjak]